MDDLVKELRESIVKSLKLETVKPESINPDAPLFVEGLGLDSIDALELVVMIEKKYGIKIATAEVGKKVLYSVNTMAAFIKEKKKNI